MKQTSERWIEGRWTRKDGGVGVLRLDLFLTPLAANGDDEHGYGFELHIGNRVTACDGFPSQQSAVDHALELFYRYREAA